LGNSPLRVYAGVPLAEFLIPTSTLFVKPSKIKPAPPKIMEMFLKKEIGTAKAILDKVCFTGYRL